MKNQLDIIEKIFPTKCQVAVVVDTVAGVL